MNKDDIIKALKGIEGVDEAILSAIEAMDTPTRVTNESDELKEAKATAKRILAEKKALQTKLSDYESQIEEVKNADLTELEKLQKTVEKMNKSQEALQKQYEESQKSLSDTKRSYGLERIAKKAQFVDGVPAYMRDLAIKEAFKDIEDLDDEDIVNDTFKSFTEVNKGILVAENDVSGTGSHGNGVNKTNGTRSKDPERQSKQERLAAIKGKM